MDVVVTKVLFDGEFGSIDKLVPLNVAIKTLMIVMKNTPMMLKFENLFADFISRFKL